MSDYIVVIKVEICECKDKQEAINFVADNLQALCGKVRNEQYITIKRVNICGIFDTISINWKK